MDYVLFVKLIYVQDYKPNTKKTPSSDYTINLLKIAISREKYFHVRRCCVV